MPAKKGYKVGESVFGLWPGSGGLYFKAVVVERDADEGTYDLKFEEGTVYTLLEKHVKPMDSFKSLEPKSGKRTVGRPRGRSGSASRSTSRSRSTTPGRRGRPPGSPNKGKKSPEVKKEDVTDDVPLNKRVSRATVKQEVKEEVVASVEDVSRRRSTRLAVKTEVPKTEAPETKHNGKDGLNESKNDSLSLGRKSVHSEASGETYTGLFAAALHTLLILAGVTFLHLACQHNKCLIKGIQIAQSHLVALYQPCVALSVAGFYLLIFVLSLLPVGNTTQLSGGIRRNSVVTLLALIASLLASKQYLNLSATQIMKHVPQFLVPNFLVGFLLACVVAFQTRGSGVGFLSRFIIGTSANASLAGVNLKIWLHHATCLTAIALNVLAEVAHFERTGSLSPMLALVAGMQIVYSLEALMNENSFLNSFEYLHIKTGWMLLSSLASPLLTFLITLSVIKSGINLPYYCLAPIAVAFLAGLWIKIGSNMQKSAFLNDPNHPAFSNMEVLTTSSGEKLLISGWYGWLRQPNYLGDILMYWAFVLPCGYDTVLPHIVALFNTVCFLYRAQQNDAAAKLKYGPSWDRYCQRVPSRVIPRVF